MTNHRARRIAAPLAAVLCAALATDYAPGQCSYEVSAIIQGPACPPNEWIVPLFGTGMNSLGYVTGFHYDCNQGAHDHDFFWTPQTGRVTMHKPPDVWNVLPR